ncbi:MAG: response regulator [Chitinispirillaceae bacterium]|jgi:CheY-like chemotaxis protein|nr:response regulator [Chitinispirillaceae bacterium]
MKQKILVIEDNEQNMYMISYLLKSNNFDVVQSFNGADGIAMAIEVNPDAILLDIQLPGMDGYSVVRELRKNNLLNNIPIIAVTSYAMSGDSEKAYEAGADGYIEKPIDPDKFISQLKIYMVKNRRDKK